MISAAQGRVQGRQPAAVIDIGSNSVRLVVYEGVNRSPTVLFNEKILCGLGKGLAKTKKLNAKAVQSALRALRRFRALADQAGAVSLDVLATAAAREAENGSQFIKEAEALLKEPIRVLSGREEAYYSALGIISGVHDPDGIAGDLGGGSLELVDVRGRQIGDGITLPLGGLRLRTCPMVTSTPRLASPGSTFLRQSCSPMAGAGSSMQSAVPGETSRSCT